VWTLHCNIPIARRMTLCFVTDETGKLRWSGKNVGAAFRWLHEQDVHRFHLEGLDPDERFYVFMKPI